MRTAISMLVTVALIVSTVAALPAAGVAQGALTGAQPVAPIHEQQQAGDGLDENASEVTPGERLVGVVGVQEAEIEGELEQRTFGIKIARAASANATADVVKAQLDAIEQRLGALEERKQELDAARENGSITEGRYRAEVAALAAQSVSAEQLTNQSEARANELPSELLERKGINASAIQRLKQHAENLTGPEVAEIARSIAGPDVGQSMAAANRPGDAGPPGDRDSGVSADADDDANRTGDADRRGNDDDNETVAGDQRGGDRGGSGGAY